MLNTVDFRKTGSSDTGRNLSPELWSVIPWEEMLHRPSDKGIMRYYDLGNMPLAGTQTTQIGWGDAFKVYAASGCAFAPVSNPGGTETIGGALQMSTDTDDDEAAFAEAYPAFRLSGLTTSSGPLVFECCFAQNSIATNMAAVFFGLAEVDLFTLGANVPMNSADAIDASGAMIGFRIEEDGLGVVDTVYSDRATSFTNIGDTEGGTLTANTFTKFGMVYDPNNVNECVKFYVNNVKCSTAMTRAALIALTNLDANNLGFLWCAAADSAATSYKGWMKWAAIGQMFPVGA